MVEDMDFSLNVGDERICYYQIDSDKEMPLRFVATAVSDTILNNTDRHVPRKCIHVLLPEGQTNAQDSDIWIDGIGSVRLGLDGMGMIQAAGSIPKLYRVTDVNGVIYQSTLPPSWVNGLTTVRKKMTPDNTINDLQGRRLASPQKGINIIRQSDGTTRKVIVK